MPVLELFVIFGLLYLIWLFLYSMIFGAPYAAIGKKRLEVMMDIADIKRGDRVCDLGSGDGRIVIAVAKRGVIAIGYEINPLLYIVSLIRIRRSNVNATIHLKDIWSTNLARYDVVMLYGNFPMMKRLEKKLYKELRPGARVISNHFQFPTWKPKKQKDDVFLYVK